MVPMQTFRLCEHLHLAPLRLAVTVVASPTTLQGERLNAEQLFVVRGIEIFNAASCPFHQLAALNTDVVPKASLKH